MSAHPIEALLRPLPDDVVWKKQVRPPLEVVVAFFTSRSKLVAAWPKLTAAVAPSAGSGLWRAREDRNQESEFRISSSFWVFGF